MTTAIDNIVAKSNYDVSVSYRFPDIDISEAEFYAQIANHKGEIIAAFARIKAEDVLTLSLTRAQVNLIPLGEYVWDLKMVRNTQDPLIEGKFIRAFGATELP